MVEIINTGNELLNGARLNTHQQWLTARFARHGFEVTRQTAIADNGNAIEEAVRESVRRARVTITTGGLGPTSDDMTREKIAGLLGRELIHDPGIESHLEEFFAKRNKVPSPRTMVQAKVPEGAIVLMNHHGTAPGLVIDIPATEDTPETMLIMLPGPPRELYPMMTEQVIPLLEERFPGRNQMRERFVRTTGLGESAVEEAIGGHLEPLKKESGLGVAFCLHPGHVDVRLTSNRADADAVLDSAVALVRSSLDAYIFSDAEEEIEEVVIRKASESSITLAVAESCTGGLLSNRLTDVPGASEVYLCGLTTYSNEAKQTFLRVSSNTLETKGAVSRETAMEMAKGLMEATGADIAVTTTGIAGPGGGSEEKPVGTVFIGYATSSRSGALKMLNPYDRETFKRVTSQQALGLMLKLLIGKDPD